MFPGEGDPPPSFFASAESKGLSIFCKLFVMNTYERGVQLFILKGLFAPKLCKMGIFRKRSFYGT